MNRWFVSQVLVTVLFLGCSALTPEECKPLVTPVSLVNMMHGKMNFIMGYTNNEIYNSMMKWTDSSWLKITPSPSNPNHLVMHEENRINGTCFASAFNGTIEGDTTTAALGNMSSSLHLLPSCDGCLVLSSNITVRNLNKLLQVMNMTGTVEEGEVTSHGFYLMSREPTVKDSDLKHFQQQASCFGYSGEPPFHYDGKSEFCKEGEGHMFPLI
ncbi:uncharacterized protein LOC113126158 [Mastacembelus armatus]|uniref:uncharacterized protein LOC113126158 n=1 Tax=Mastacembelus armatus TaxID=205130 RepID=UPI000E462D62|nr:uncharacterized protein LOC113126158 [Mastacembelus armatus]